MLPRIDAEERLAQIDTSAVAFGSLESKDAEKVLSRLEEMRDGCKRVPVKASPEALAAMGIAIVAPMEGVSNG